jgi:hypothetical protein
MRGRCDNYAWPRMSPKRVIRAFTPVFDGLWTRVNALAASSGLHARCALLLRRRAVIPVALSLRRRRPDPAKIWRRSHRHRGRCDDRAKRDAADNRAVVRPTAPGPNGGAVHTHTAAAARNATHSTATTHSGSATHSTAAAHAGSATHSAAATHAAAAHSTHSSGTTHSTHATGAHAATHPAHASTHAAHLREHNRVVIYRIGVGELRPSRTRLHRGQRCDGRQNCRRQNCTILHDVSSLRFWFGHEPLQSFRRTSRELQYARCLPVFALSFLAAFNGAASQTYNSRDVADRASRWVLRDCLKLSWSPNS